MPARLKLVIRPDGRAILTSSDPLSDIEARILADAFQGWEEGQTLILANCDVVAVVDVTLDGRLTRDPVGMTVIDEKVTAHALAALAEEV